MNKQDRYSGESTSNWNKFFEQRYAWKGQMLHAGLGQRSIRLDGKKHIAHWKEDIHFFLRSKSFLVVVYKLIDTEA